VSLTLRSRLTWVYTAIFGVLLTAVGVASYRVLAYQLDADANARLAELTDGLHGYLQFDGTAPRLVFDATDAAEAAFIQEATRYYQVFEAGSGRLLVQSDALRPMGVDFAPSEVRAYIDRPRIHDLQTDYGRVRFSNTVLRPDKGSCFLLQVGISMASTDRTLDRFLVLLLVGVPAGLVVAFTIGHWAARLALSPLTRLADATRLIGVDDLSRRVPLRGAGDELDGVAAAFNQTLARLERTIGDMRQFSAALAHELRTPLAALRGSVELALRERAGDAASSERLASQLEEIDKLTHLIDQILVLARADAGQIPLSSAAVDLCAMASSIVTQLEPVAQASRVELRCDACTSVVVRGDADWLKRLLLNLLDNALRFTPSGGLVSVTVSQEHAMATLRVRDTGDGIDPDLLPHIFERFVRAETSRARVQSGAGLGLALAKWIVERHRGRIGVESRVGRGTTFTVELPLNRA
jgi:two-component system OmpR family sensor kinase